MKVLFFNQFTRPNLAVVSLAETPGDFASAAASIIDRGKFPSFVGAFSFGEVPIFGNPMNLDALRVSAGVIVLKLGIVSDIRWKLMRREAQSKLDETNDDAIRALEEGSANPVLAAYRRDLRAIIAAKPAELLAAANLSAIESARPKVLDRPIQRP